MTTGAVCIKCGTPGHTSSSCRAPLPSQPMPSLSSIVVMVRKVPGGVRYSTRVSKINEESGCILLQPM